MTIIIPLNKRVIVEPEAREKQSPGGIIIPETANQKAPTSGRVIAIAEDINLKIKVGDIVLFSKFAGTELNLAAVNPQEKDRQLLIMKDEDIIAKIENA